MVNDGHLSAILNPARACNVVLRGRLVTDKMYHVGPRKIPDHLIYWVEYGSYAGTVEGEPVSVTPRRLFWLRPGAQHHFSPAGLPRRTAILFFRFYLGAAAGPRHEAPYAFLSPGVETGAVMAALVSESQAGQPASTRQRALLSSLLSRPPEESGEARKGLSEAGEAKVREFVDKHLRRRFPMGALAECAGLNAVYFSRQFKTQFGMTAREWVKRERIRAACSLLSESRMQVQQVAFQLGFEDVYFFSRQFKSVTGKSPRAWKAGQG